MSLSISGTAEQIAWMQDRDADRRWMVRIYPKRISDGVRTYHYFTEFAWTDSEDANYQPRIVGDIRLDNELPDLIYGGERISEGEVLIDNNDGVYDHWIFTHDFVGEEIKVYGIDPDNSTWVDTTDYALMFDGKMSSIEVLDSATIKIRFSPVVGGANTDIAAKTTTTFAGQEQRLPVLWGKVLNITPLIYTNAAESIDDDDFYYQVAGYPGTKNVSDISAVYLSGVSQTNGGDYPTITDLKNSVTLGAGEYETCVAENVFRLGSNPDSEAVTCDVTGPATVITAGEIIEEIADSQAAAGAEVATSWEMQSTLLAAYQSDAPYTNGIFVTSGTPVLDVVSDIVKSNASVYWWNNANEMCLAVLFAPFEDPSLPEGETSEGDIDESLDIIGDVEVRRWTQPVYRKEVRYARNHTVLQQDSLPASLAGANDIDRDFATEEWRSAVNVSQVVSDKFTDAQQVITDSTLLDLTGAQPVATAYFNVMSGLRHVYRLTAWNRPGGYALMDTWTLYHSRWAPGGKKLKIIGSRDNLMARTTELTLWG